MRGILRSVIILWLSSLALFMCFRSRSQAETVLDQLKRRVTLPADPQRIISLAPSITEIIYALGQGNRLKAVTRYSDFPVDATKLPKIGSYVRIDLEKFRCTL
jgi:iron complex transport system substrate-binding protein